MWYYVSTVFTMLHQYILLVSLRFLVLLENDETAHKHMSNLLGGEVEIIGCSTRDLRGSKPPLPAACHLLWCQSWLGHHLSEARKNEPIHLKTDQHVVVRRNFFDPGVTLNTFLWFETMYLPIQKTHVYSGSRIRKMLPARPLLK